MALSGKIVSGAFDVKIGGQPAARKSDIIDHGGLIVDGCETVLIGGASLCAATILHRFTCPDAEIVPVSVPHRGGIILPPGFPTVLIGGKPAARKGDSTTCLGAASTVGDGDGSADGAPRNSDCAALWKKYEDQAKDMLSAGDDYRAKNKIINAAYAGLYLQDHSLAWAGLAAYASKQVGCAMDHAQALSSAAKDAGGPAGAMSAPADYTIDKLGEGNCALFCDIYPDHLFYMNEGYAKMAQCASERRPPVPAQVLDGFRALDRYKQSGDRKDLAQHIASIAMHEQINVLQSGVYNDPLMQGILQGNETSVGGVSTPFQSPAKAVLGSKCTAGPGDFTSNFNNGERDQLYNVPQRMDWILNDVAGPYMNNVQGTPKMDRDMQAIQHPDQGAGGNT